MAAPPNCVFALRPTFFSPSVQEKQKNSGISHLLSLVRCLPLSDFYFI